MLLLNISKKPLPKCLASGFRCARSCWLLATLAWIASLENSRNWVGVGKLPPSRFWCGTWPAKLLSLQAQLGNLCWIWGQYIWTPTPRKQFCVHIHVKKTLHIKNNIYVYTFSLLVYITMIDDVDNSVWLILTPYSKDNRLKGGALCAWSLSRAINIMDCSDIVLSTNDAVEIHDRLKEHLLHWQGLSQLCKAVGVARWKIRPKHHDLEEIGLFTKKTKINPRFTACWQDESYLGQVKHVANKCHSSNALLRVFQRIILRLAQKWRDTREQHTWLQQRGTCAMKSLPPCGGTQPEICSKLLPFTAVFLPRYVAQTANCCFDVHFLNGVWFVCTMSC